MSTLRDEMEEMMAVRQSLGFDGNSTRNMLNYRTPLYSKLS